MKGIGSSENEGSPYVAERNIIIIGKIKQHQYGNCYLHDSHDKIFKRKTGMDKFREEQEHLSITLNCRKCLR